MSDAKTRPNKRNAGVEPEHADDTKRPEKQHRVAAPRTVVVAASDAETQRQIAWKLIRGRADHSFRKSAHVLIVLFGAKGWITAPEDGGAQFMDCIVSALSGEEKTTALETISVEFANEVQHVRAAVLPQTHETTSFLNDCFNNSEKPPMMRRTKPWKTFQTALSKVIRATVASMVGSYDSTRAETWCVIVLPFANHIDHTFWMCLEGSQYLVVGTNNSSSSSDQFGETVECVLDDKRKESLEKSRGAFAPGIKTLYFNIDGTPFDEPREDRMHRSFELYEKIMEE